MNRVLPCILIFLILTGPSCGTVYRAEKKEHRNISIQPDSGWLQGAGYDAARQLIEPYKKKVDTETQLVIGSTEVILLRQKPEGTLCNLAADAVKEKAEQLAYQRIDLCVLNYGGLRIPSIGKGDITTGKVFELMPFENELVLLTVKGSTLKELFHIMALNGGWPVSGAAFRIKDQDAIEIQIGQVALDSAATYQLVTSDYLANGGDNASCLKEAIHRKDLHYKVRDAITDYIKLHSPLNLSLQGRIR
ncbi:MAG: 5'-nucleotidase [Bacteroidia bacterium]|jgi:2',3'-cyclic-nucleotide 2'-phosphodiesterase (5'-nucleotidase family)